MGSTMGGSTFGSQSYSQQTMVPTPSAWENQFDPLLLALYGGQVGNMTANMNAGSALTNSLLSGAQLPGAYSGAGGQSSIYGVGPEAQQNIINQSMRTLPTSLQGTGMLDSGASQALYQRGAQNVGAQLAQFNTGAQQSALGMGYGGITQSTAPAQQAGQMLTSLLPGLRTINQTGYSNTQGTYTPSLMSQIGQGLQLAGQVGSLSTGTGSLSSILGGTGNAFSNFLQNADSSGWMGNGLTNAIGGQAGVNAYSGATGFDPISGQTIQI